ncbi:universal stress protein [Enterococcus alishanensis]
MKDKILVLVESSGNPKGALKKAIKLANKDKSELHVLIYNTTLKETMALEETEEDSYYSGAFVAQNGKLIEEIANENNEETKEFLSQIKLDEQDDLIISYVFNGLKKTIINYAQEKAIDLIILGQDEEIYGHLALGSLIKHIIKNSQSDLLIIN